MKSLAQLIKGSSASTASTPKMCALRVGPKMYLQTESILASINQTEIFTGITQITGLSGWLKFMGTKRSYTVTTVQCGLPNSNTSPFYAAQMLENIYGFRQ